MSRENVEIVRRFFEARGREAELALLDPEIEWHVRPDLPDADVYKGHDGWSRLVDTFDEALDDRWYSLREVFDVDDQVVVVLRWGGRGKTSGLAIEERDEAWILTLRNGLVIRVDEHASRADALEAAGLSE